MDGEKEGSKVIKSRCFSCLLSVLAGCLPWVRLCIVYCVPYSFVEGGCWSTTVDLLELGKGKKRVYVGRI
jgi:hypothetical protein